VLARRHLSSALDQSAFLPVGAAHVGKVRSAESGEFAGGVGKLDGVAAVGVGWESSRGYACRPYGTRSSYSALTRHCHAGLSHAGATRLCLSRSEVSSPYLYLCDARGPEGSPFHVSASSVTASSGALRNCAFRRRPQGISCRRLRILLTESSTDRRSGRWIRLENEARACLRVFS
jgi:hypothetical protein